MRQFSSVWIGHAFLFFTFCQFLDGITTKIGLDLGLAEVGIYAMSVLDQYGFVGLMIWKYGILAALGVMIVLTYYAIKHYSLENLQCVSKILFVGILIAGIISLQIVILNSVEILQLSGQVII